MPIDIAPYPTSNPQERFRLAVAATARRPEPLAELDNSPSFKQTMVDSFTRDSITGSFLTDFVPYWSKITSGQVSSELDPAFDPYKEYANPEWLNAHPYMVDSFVNGDVFDIPNRQRFEWFMARQKEDYDIRQRIGSAGLAQGILAAIPGQIIDGLVGGLALRGLGLAGKAAQAGEWLKAGGFAARTGKSAIMGGALNLAQEEALRALNPSRHVDEGQAALWAVGLGAAFGSGAHMLASGKTKLGKWLDPVRAKLISQQVAADLSDPKFHGIDEQAAADAEMLKAELNSVRKAQTSEVSSVKYAATEIPPNVVDRGSANTRPFNPLEYTAEEMRVLAQTKRAEENNIEAAVLGEAGAKEWKKLQRNLNSNDPNVHEKASARIAEIEASLSKSDYNKLYGIGETGPTASDIREYYDAAELMLSHDENVDTLSSALGTVLIKLPDATKDVAKLTAKESRALYQLKVAQDIAIEKGFDTTTLFEKAVKHSAGKFSDPADAMYVLKQFLNKDAPKNPPATPSSPSLPPGLSVGASTPAGTRLREGEEQAAADAEMLKAELNSVRPSEVHSVRSAQTEVPPNHIAATRSAQTGRPYSATVHRGVIKGRIATETSDSVGNALFFTPDIEAARVYSAPTKGGMLVTKEVNLANPLVADNWFEAKSAIGLPRKATMEDLIGAARKAGHDGLVFTANHNTNLPPEVVVFDPSLLKDTKPSLPPGLSVGAATPAGTRLREGEIKRFTVLRTPLTEQYMKAVEEHYKGNVEWAEHPQQYAADAQEVLRKLDDEMKKLVPADLGGVRNAVVKTLGAVTPARKLYDPNINPSAFSRLVSRVLFDFATQTQEGYDNPLSGQTFVPAEGLRMVYNGWASEARIGLDEAFREAWQAKATHRMLDGRDVTIGRLSKKDFAEAVQEHIYATDEAVRGHRPAPEAHPTVEKAAAIVSEYYRKIGMDGKASGYLKDMVDPSRPHFTQQWLTDKIERNAGDFKRRLIAEWEYNRNVDFATGQVMDPEVRTLKMDVVNPEKVRKGKNAGGLTEADREAINRYAKDNERPLEEVTEMDLRDEFGPEMAQRYEQEVQIYFDKAADSTIESLTRIVSTRHGVLDAMDEIPADVRKGRLLQINPTRFSDYLERDAFRLLESYDHMVSGRIATRMAIKRNAKLIDPFYKELMGHTIAADDYNPGKLIEAINKHFQQYIKDERIPTDVRDRFQKARDVILGEKAGVLTNKLAELEHRASGSPVGWQLFLDRNLPRMPFLAQMGKVTMAAFNDLASTAFGRRIGNEQVGALSTILRGFVGKPRRDIEGLYVATIDSIRSLRGDDVSDYIPNLERGRFGGGLTGSAMSVADTSLGIAQKGLVAATGINRWSQAMRRTVAGQLLQDIIVGAKKMHAASNLVGQGFTQDKAFAKVGLAIEDARRLNRLGFNAERSKRLLEQIDAHGVDAFGNKVDSTHDGYISPEMSKWWKQDRDLYDTLNAAVNSETLNLIVEPKILSRPLMNNTLLGKLFNQFQGFAMAWGTQLAPLAMQRGGHEIAMYVGLMVGLGAIADALRNELTGRRTIDDSIKQWKENPAGMAYGAIDRSGLTGWLSRPLGLLEQTPYGIGKMLKNDRLSSAYGRPGDLIDQLGPVAGWSNKVYKGTVGSLYDGGWNKKNQMLLWRAMPFNNLWAVEGFNRAAERMGFDTPIGPRFQYQGGR